MKFPLYLLGRDSPPPVKNSWTRQINTLTRKSWVNFACRLLLVYKDTQTDKLQQFIFLLGSHNLAGVPQRCGELSWNLAVLGEWWAWKWPDTCCLCWNCSRIYCCIQLAAAVGGCRRLRTWDSRSAILTSLHSVRRGRCHASIMLTPRSTASSQVSSSSVSSAVGRANYWSGISGELVATRSGKTSKMTVQRVPCLTLMDTYASSAGWILLFLRSAPNSHSLRWTSHVCILILISRLN